MTWIVARLALSGIPDWLSKLIAYVGAPLILAGLLYLAVTSYGSARYAAGVSDEKAAERERERTAQEAQRERERQATAQLEQRRRQDAAAAANRTQEITDATAHLPDQKPSARQSARACLSLRAEAKARGEREPTC